MILVSVPKSAIFGYLNPIMATNFHYVITRKPKGYILQIFILHRTPTKVHIYCSLQPNSILLAVTQDSIISEHVKVVLCAVHTSHGTYNEILQTRGHTQMHYQLGQ